MKNATESGSEYRDRLAGYLAQRFGPFGVEVRTEVSYGRNGSGGGRRHDIMLLSKECKPLAVECRNQRRRGSAEYKVSFVLTEVIRKDDSVAAIIAVGGSGWSGGFRGWMEQQPEIFFCEPRSDMAPSRSTRTIDEVVGRHFGVPIEKILDREVGP